jgi:hypothetical protein
VPGFSQTDGLDGQDRVLGEVLGIALTRPGLHGLPVRFELIEPVL